MSKSFIMFFVCLLSLVGCKSSELTTTKQGNTVQTSPSPATQLLITEVPLLTPTSLSVVTQSLSTTASVHTPTPFVVAVAPTDFPIEIDIDLREYVAQQGIVLYSKLEQSKFALLSWPELPPILNEPLFKTLYGEQIGYLYTSDFAPDLDATGRYLLVPGVISETNTAPNNTTAWLVDLNTDRIQPLEKNPQSAVWSPNGQNLAYIVNETLYVKSMVEDGQTTEIFSKTGLNEFFLAWSPDSKQVAVISTIVDEDSGGDAPLITDTLWVITLENKMQQALGEFSIVPMEHHRKELQWSPDGSAIMVGMAMPNRIFSLPEGELVLEEGVRTLDWASYRPNLLIQQGTNLSIFDPVNDEVVTNIANLERPLITAWAFSASGRYLAYADQREIHIFDLELQKEHATIMAPSAPVASLFWVPGDYDVLVIDDGDWNTPIWAVSLNDQAEVLIEKGLLINFIPPPQNDD